MGSRRIFAALVTVLFCIIVSPLLMPFLTGAIFSVIFYPWLTRLERRGVSRPVGSALITCAVTFVFIIPAAFLGFAAVKSGLGQLYDLQKWVSSRMDQSSGNIFEGLAAEPWAKEWIERAERLLPMNSQEIISAAQDLAAGTGIRIADLLGKLLGHLPSVIMALAIVVVSFFFFLLDGRGLVEFVKRHSFFSQKQTDQLLRALGKMCRSVILAIVVSGAAQSALFSLTCLFTGTGSVALVALFVFLTSVLPIVGSAPITLGVAGFQFLEGQMGVGIALTIVAVLVTIIDNLIRPWILKGAGNLHPLIAFAAVFGGIQTLGIMGVFLGPIIAGLFMVTIQILIEKES